MIHSTKAIVLQTIKYSETSLVVTAYTELFGLQTYMVNAVRQNKKGGAAAIRYQPAAILDLIVYYQDQKRMHRIKESSWSVIYDHVLTDVIKNNIALFMVELVHHSLQQPEQNTDLFLFLEDALIHLDRSDYKIAANIPLFFSLQLTAFFGLHLHNDTKLHPPFFLDLKEALFVKEQPKHPYFLQPEYAAITAELLKIRTPEELTELQLNKQTRRLLLNAYEDFFELHIAGFRRLRTLNVLNEVL